MPASLHSPAPKSSSPKPRRPGCLPFALGILFLPFIGLLAVVVLSVFPDGRAMLGRLGSAVEVLRGKTPSIDLDGDREDTLASATHPVDEPALPTLPPPLSPASPNKPTEPTEPVESSEPVESTDSAEADEPEQPEATTGPLPRLPDKIPREPTWDPTRLFNGVVVETEVVRTDGGLAQEIRRLPEAYRARWQVEVMVPEPARTIEELSVASPGLGELLPGLKEHLVDAEVSRVWHEMYRRKFHALGSSLSNLGEAPWRHNFFDLNTALQFDGDQGTRAFLMQADMDIVTDGSDGDRLPQMPEEIISAQYYQSTTSYGWPKQSERENPLVERYRRGNEDAKGQIADARAELATGVSAARRGELENLIAAQQRRQEINEGIIADLRARSYLIAEYDPFIVLPIWVITWNGQDNAAIPGIGDYAVVIHGDRAYPAIVGDAGPNQKVGEASLRLAREVDPDVSQYRGAVDDLGITYLIFPGSAERPFGPPDYDRWHERCAELLDSLGGLGEGHELHRWENTLPPLPGTPEVTPAEAGAAENEPGGEEVTGNEPGTAEDQAGASGDPTGSRDNPDDKDPQSSAEPSAADEAP